MQIFRLENENGKGPFTGASPACDKEWEELKYSGGRYWSPTMHLSPYDDGLLDSWMDDLDPNLIFGCPNIDSLNLWFPKEWMDMLKRHNFKVLCLEVPDNEILVSRSGIQVMFLRDAITEITEL